MKRRDCQLLGQSGEGEGTGFPLCVAGQGSAGLHQEVERSSGLLSSARVLCFVAGPPPSAGLGVIPSVHDVVRDGRFV